MYSQSHDLSSQQRHLGFDSNKTSIYLDENELRPLSNKNTKPKKPNIEIILGSRVRIRIIKTLLAEEPLYLTIIARKVKCSTSNTKYHLKILEKLEIVMSRIVFGGFRIYKLNRENPLLLKIIRVFQ